jgi:hypothetical protein
MTRSTNIPLDELVVVRDQASALIRAEVRAGEQRAQLERAVRDAVCKLGRSVDDVSEASGLTVAEIRKIVATPQDLDLELIAG